LRASGRVGGAGTGPVEEKLGIADDLFGLLFVDGEAAEFGAFEHGFDLGGERLALSSPRGDFIFEIVLGGVAIGSALDGESGNGKSALREGAERGVDLFVGLAETEQGFGMGVQAGRQNFGIEHFENDAAGVRIDGADAGHAASGYSSFIHNCVNDALCFSCDTGGVLKPVHGTIQSKAAYRIAPGYDTLPPSQRTVRSTRMKRILIIEDDRDIVELVRYNLANEGFQVSGINDGASGLSTLKKSPPDLLLLDLMLPKLSGLEICREVRKDESLNRLPILMLTARGDEADRVVGLEMGADDYVTKPFSPRELIARVKALLRRAEPPADSPRTIELGKLSIDPASYRVSCSGKTVPLSTLEFRLLYYLASRPNRVFTRDQLLDAVWGTDRFVTPRSVDVYVRRLREKIEPDPENPLHLKTVRGAGYLFETRAA